jgi:hypothetical protein
MGKGKGEGGGRERTTYSVHLQLLLIKIARNSTIALRVNIPTLGPDEVVEYLYLKGAMCPMAMTTCTFNWAADWPPQC